MSKHARRHPVSPAVESVTAAREAFGAKGSSQHASQLTEALQSLRTLLEGTEAEGQAQALSGLALLQIRTLRKQAYCQK